MSSEALFLVGKTFTFTSDEENEIAMRLREAQRALWIRNDGYRSHVIGCITRVNRIIAGALNRAHGLPEGLPRPPIMDVPPGLSD